MLYRSHASVGARLIAYLLDSLILIIPLSMARGLLSVMGDFFTSKAVLFRWTLSSVIVYIITALYFILMTKMTGQTLGKRIMNIKVVSTNTVSLGWIQVIYRETVGKFLSAFLLIGYIVLLFNRNRRALHDLICDTAVLSNNTFEAPADYQKSAAPQPQYAPAGFSPCPPPINTAPSFVPPVNAPYENTDPHTVAVPPGSIPGGPVVFVPQPYGFPQQPVPQPGFAPQPAFHEMAASAPQTEQPQCETAPEISSEPETPIADTEIPCDSESIGERVESVTDSDTAAE